MPKALKTNASVWTSIFRAIVQKCATDPDIRRVVGTNLRSWSGVDADKAPFQPSTNQPIVRMTPNPQGVDWYFEDAQSGTLNVRLEIGVQSLCIDDVVDLYDLFVTALNPSNLTFTQSLTVLGAETGEIVFDSPAFDPQPDADPEGFFFATGNFHLRVLRTIF